MDQNMEEDLQAVRRLKNGDMGGLESLVDRYQGKAVRAAFLILRDRQMAEDVAQETFLRIFRHIRRFDERRPFGPYFLRSVINSALEVVRKESQRKEVANGLESIEGLLDYAPAAEDEAEFEALKADVRSALDRLSPRQRATVVMRYYLDMSEREMAESLAAPIGTVKWLLSEARRRMQSLLTAERSPK
jgi:RNA polymerase sigma-70 factor (ECF subfamily)